METVNYLTQASNAAEVTRDLLAVCAQNLPGCAGADEEAYHVADPRNGLGTWACAPCYGAMAVSAERSGCTGMQGPEVLRG